MPEQAKLILLVCAGFGLFAWTGDFYGLYREAGSDWVIFYQASQDYLHGHLALLLDGDAFTAELNQAFAGWFAHPLPLHAWIYPPVFLLLFLPFGLMPAVVAYPVFLLVTGIGLIVALLRCFGTRASAILDITLIALNRAVSYALLTGQNSFLSSAVLIGGFTLLECCPLAAGALFGVLSFKPQLGLMIPIALIAGRHWRAFAAAVASAGVLALTSLLLFGSALWSSWIMLALGRGDLYTGWLPTARIYAQSVFSDAVALGVPAQFANLLQGLATLCAAAIVFAAFRRQMPDRLRLAVLLAGTVLAAPHIAIYDTILLATAAILLFRHAIETGFRRDDAPLILALWLSPLINPPAAIPIGAVTPLLILAFMIRLLTRDGWAGVQPSRVIRSHHHAI